MGRKIRFASISVARSDFGRMERLYRELACSSRYELILAVGAGHHHVASGHSLGEVEVSSIPIDVVLSPAPDSSPGQQSAVVISELFGWLKDRRPDALILLGDRFEMLAAAQAALLSKVPIVHIGGGHLTRGALDERVRHAISKLSALHFVASENCAQRVVNLHEDPEYVYVTGAPELDALKAVSALPRDTFFKSLGLDSKKPLALVTFHPETNVDRYLNEQFAEEARRALINMPHQILITAPCVDPGFEPFVELCESLPISRYGVSFVPNLGLNRYISAMHHAELMVGNSSSGIIEATSLGLPVVNVGDRQALRDRALNVVDAAFDAPSILNAVKEATNEEFVLQCQGLDNPFGDGRFVERAIDIFDNLLWPLAVSKSWIF